MGRAEAESKSFANATFWLETVAAKLSVFAIGLGLCIFFLPGRAEPWRGVHGLGNPRPFALSVFLTEDIEDTFRIDELPLVSGPFILRDFAVWSVHILRFLAQIEGLLGEGCGEGRPEAHHEE